MVGSGGLCGGLSVIRILRYLTKYELEFSTPLPFGWADSNAPRIPPDQPQSAELPDIKMTKIIEAAGRITATPSQEISRQVSRHSGGSGGQT